MGDAKSASETQTRAAVRIRLDKLVAHAGFGTRKEVNALIRAGRVRVDGDVVTVPKTQVDADAAITVDAQVVSYRRYAYYMLHKPAGVISATRDRRETVLDLIDARDQRGRELFPVGRLDRDTTGLVLLTDDGALAHALLSPGRHVLKTYRATLDRPLDSFGKEQFQNGILLLPEHVVTQPAEVVEEEANVYRVTLHEGKYHQVKRMFAHCGCHVEALYRLSMGPLALDPSLLPGDYRPLTEAEVAALRDAVKTHNEMQN